ncbi:MAG: glucose-6-phosphate isomerase, partial [Candidatus Melainabacteria bacterium HGW-Melainabacteria-1]
SRYIVATTDVSRGPLRELADRQGYQSFVIPDDVGGRYSVLTPVGLLPAAVAGIDIQAVMAGAREMAELCRRDSLRENPAYLYAALQHLSYCAGRGVSVMNIWDKALEYVGFWYDQLCAESLGKQDQGRIPLTGVCTRDLHSRGQELQQGPRNTVITNLQIERADRSLSLEADAGDGDGLNYLAGTSLQHMLHQAAAGTNYAYARDSRPNLEIVLQDRSAFTLGAFFYLMEVSTVAEGYLMGINPMDQPGVESYKNFMFGLLGREDKRQYRDEFEQRPPRQSKYSL